MTTKIKSGVIGDNVVGITQLNVSDGTNGQVLTTDGSGTLSFSTISGYTDSDVETYLNTSEIYTDATNNRLGIGTNSPAAVLHISKDVGNTELEALRLSNFDPDKPNSQVGHAVSLSFELPANDGGNTDGKLAAKIVGIAGANGTNDWYTASESTNFQGQLDFYTRNDDVLTNQMTLNENGELGIGTTNPTIKLDVNCGADNVAARFTSTDAGSYIQFMDNDATGHYIGTVSNNLVILNTSNVERLRINSAGQLVVGTSSNASGTRVHIDGGSSNLGQLGLRNSSATSGNHWRMGQNSDSHYIHYNQSGTGVYILNGGTSWSGNSDETIKENIVELTGVLDKVKNFRCVEYNLISDETNSKKIGFIAQDWQEDYSQVISQDENGKLGMAYTETIPVLLKAIQELKTELDAAKARITTLEG